MIFDSNTPTLREAIEGLGRVRATTLPKTVKRILYNIGLVMKEEAILQARRPEIYRVGQNKADLPQHASRQSPQVVGPARVVWGLPEGSLISRIGRFIEEGGTIKPRIAKMLRIPQPPSLTAAGVDRYAGQRLREVGGFRIVYAGRNFPIGLVKEVTTVKEMKRQARTGRSDLWYKLVYREDVPPKPWFSVAVDRTRARVPEVINAAMRELLEKA
jgi:hypothetical protein